MVKTVCRAKDPKNCRYHGTGRYATARTGMAHTATAGVPLPTHMVKTGVEIGKMFRFVNRLKGGYIRSKHQRPRNLAADSFAWTKPSGGLWISTLNDEGVSSWDELWGGEPAAHHIEKHVTFNDDAKVLVIDSLADYRAILDGYPHHVVFGKNVSAYVSGMGDLLSGGMSAVNPDGSAKRGMDFEKLAHDYDGIVLTQRGLYKCGRQDFLGHMGGDMSLYLWDIESAFVLNRDAITVE